MDLLIGVRFDSRLMGALRTVPEQDLTGMQYPKHL